MFLKHGLHKSAEYNSWHRMKRRCYGKSDPAYSYYGGRGVVVCARWRDSFSHFIEDMGAKPTPKHTLDRIDPDKGYSPDNCRWADRTTQARNRRAQNSLGLNGVKVREGKYWARIGVNGKTINLGLTDNFFDACCLRKSAENRLWSDTRNNQMEN